MREFRIRVEDDAVEDLRSTLSAGFDLELEELTVREIRLINRNAGIAHKAFTVGELLFTAESCQKDQMTNIAIVDVDDAGALRQMFDCEKCLAQDVNASRFGA